MQWMLDGVICVSLGRLFRDVFPRLGRFAGSAPGARGGSRERIPGGRSAHPNGRRRAHLRPGSGGVTPKALAATVPTLTWAEARLPGGGTSAPAVTGVPRAVVWSRSFASAPV